MRRARTWSCSALDVTHRALTSRALGRGDAGDRPHRRPRSPAGPISSSATTRTKYGSDGAPLHDPCTIAWLIRPDLFAGRRINVEIETEGQFTTGMTVADWWGVTGRPANALFMREVDADGLFALLRDRIGGLDAAAS